MALNSGRFLIFVFTLSISLDPASTIGWDSYAGVSVSCVKSNFLYLINDSPLIQSGLAPEGLGNTVIKPTQEGPLLVKCIDPMTKNRIWMLDPNAIHAPDSGVQVFSANTMSLLGEGLVMNHQGIGKHAICNKFNHTALNVRCHGGVISNETEPYDTKSVALDTEVLRKLHTTVPLKDLLGIKGNSS